MFRWVYGATYDFAPGWTHVAGTFNGGLVFYRRSDGFGGIGVLAADATFTQTGNPSFGAGWTHVVGAGRRGVLLYDERTGKGLGGFLDVGGAWRPTSRYC